MRPTDNSIVQSGLKDEPPATAEIPVSAQPEALLRASRRVDWRFLLPAPNMGRVAYLGSALGSLPQSLLLFSTELAVITEASAQDNRAPYFDLAVVNTPSNEKLRQAARLVKPGGFLYVETHWRWGRSPREHIAAISDLDFIEVEAHWHWPNFESCTEIVPLDDVDALIHSFGRHRQGRVAWLKYAVGYILVRLRLFSFVAPCYSIVARKRPDSRSI